MGMGEGALTARPRRSARAGACTAPRPPARPARSPRSPGPGSRHGWSPSSLLPGAPTPSGSAGTQSTGKVRDIPAVPVLQPQPWFGNASAAGAAASSCSCCRTSQGHLSRLFCMAWRSPRMLKSTCAELQDRTPRSLRSGQCHSPKILAEGQTWFLPSPSRRG